MPYTQNPKRDLFSKIVNSKRKKISKVEVTLLTKLTFKSSLLEEGKREVTSKYVKSVFLLKTFFDITIKTSRSILAQLIKNQFTKSP